MLAGGELAAMVVMDAVLRKLPGCARATPSRRVEESFSAALGGNPEYPHYTRPAEYRGWRVPDVLLSGHHEEIRTVAPRAQRASVAAAGRRPLRYHRAVARGTARFVAPRAFSSP